MHILHGRAKNAVTVTYRLWAVRMGAPTLYFQTTRAPEGADWAWNNHRMSPDGFRPMRGSGATLRMEARMEATGGRRGIARAEFLPWRPGMKWDGALLAGGRWAYRRALLQLRERAMRGDDDR